MTVSKEDWTNGMELIYRLYDVDGDGSVTREEVDKISEILNQPMVAGRLYGNMMRRLSEQVQEIQLEER